MPAYSATMSGKIKNFTLKFRETLKLSPDLLKLQMNTKQDSEGILRCHLNGFSSTNRHIVIFGVQQIGDFYETFGFKFPPVYNHIPPGQIDDTVRIAR